MNQGKEDIQEFQYSFPYHHLTHEEDGSFYLFRHLFWGLVHYTYLKFVIGEIKNIDFETLADFGCGEGRFICEVEKIKPLAKLTGVDISHRAINFAKAFSEKSTFIQHDILERPLDTKFDIAVSLEVIEHIKPEDVKKYIKSISDSLKPGGTLIITTPTTNVPVNKKHYQHFTREMFDNLLQEDFENIEYRFLNKIGLTPKILERILANRFFICNNKLINRLIHNYYTNNFLVAEKNTGGRIFVRANKNKISYN